MNRSHENRSTAEITPEVAEPAAAVRSETGERLDEARAEFRAAWEAKVARREERLEGVRRQLAALRTASELLGALCALLGLGLWFAISRGLASPTLRICLWVGFGATALLLLLTLGLSIAWAHLEVGIEEREVEHL